MTLILSDHELKLLEEFPWLITHFKSRQLRDKKTYFHKPPFTNDYSLFDLSQDEIEELQRHRLSFINSEIKRFRDQEDELWQWNCGEQSRWLFNWMLVSVQHKIQQLERLKAIGARQFKSKGKDISELREIPLDTFIPTPPIFISPARNKYLCPIHNEKTGSFYWNKDKNTGHCFGCGWHGSVIDLYMVIHKCTVQEAARDLQNYSI